MLRALADYLWVADLCHVFLLVGKVCIRIFLQLRENIFNLLIIVTVIFCRGKIICFREQGKEIAVLVIYRVDACDTVLCKFKTMLKSSFLHLYYDHLPNSYFILYSIPHIPQIVGIIFKGIILCIICPIQFMDEFTEF